jgi:PTS system galactosamine-specific IIC component
LPGVGLALLLKVMLKIDNVAYLFIGFLIATYIEMGNVLPIAILAVCITFLSYINSRDQKAYDGGVDDDGI